MSISEPALCLLAGNVYILTTLIFTGWSLDFATWGHPVIMFHYKNTHLNFLKNNVFLSKQWYFSEVLMKNLKFATLNRHFQDYRSKWVVFQEKLCQQRRISTTDTSRQNLPGKHQCRLHRYVEVLTKFSYKSWTCAGKGFKLEKTAGWDNTIKETTSVTWVTLL